MTSRVLWHSTTEALDATPALLVDGYIATLQSPRSRETADESLRRIVRALGAGDDERAFPWHRLAFEDLMAIREQLRREVDAGRMGLSTANLSLSCMRAMLKVAHVRGHTTTQQRAALDLVKSLRGSRMPRGRALAAAELEQLWAAAAAERGALGVMLRAMIAAMVGGGLRREEVGRVRIGDVWLEERQLHVIGKGNKERIVHVDDWMREHLGPWLELRQTGELGHERLFVSFSRRRAGRPLSAWAVWSIVRRLGKSAGVPLAPHDLRRTFATRLLEQGFDLREVQLLMAHENIATTARYDKRSQAALAAKRLGARIVPVAGA